MPLPLALMHYCYKPAIFILSGRRGKRKNTSGAFKQEYRIAGNIGGNII